MSAGKVCTWRKQLLRKGTRGIPYIPEKIRNNVIQNLSGQEIQAIPFLYKILFLVTINGITTNIITMQLKNNVLIRISHVIQIVSEVVPDIKMTDVRPT